MGAEVVGGRRFSAVLLVDDRGRILLQERDDGAPIDPDCWGLVGGHVEDGEDYEPAAYRELLEETGVVAAPGTLALWREFAVDHRYTHGTVDTMRVYVASTVLADADIVCGEGRQIVFVEPDTARRLPMTSAAADILPIFLGSDRYTGLRDPPG